jgi:hypothetical protein
VDLDSLRIAKILSTTPLTTRRPFAAGGAGWGAGWVWRGGCGGVGVAGWVWRGGCGGVGVAGWVWRGGCGGVGVAGWVWRGGCGGVGCGGVGVAGWVWRGCGGVVPVLAGESHLASSCLCSVADACAVRSSGCLPSQAKFREALARVERWMNALGRVFKFEKDIKP